MLQLPTAVRAELWAALIEAVEAYQNGVSSLPVAPDLDPSRIRNFLAAFDFDTPCDASEALRIAVEGLTRWQVHTPHTRYFGLFNPCPATMGIAADTLVATFNSQIAAWSHSPFAAEVESHLIRCLGLKFGYPADSIDGTFCSGGMEANHTAVLTALASRFPDFVTGGVRALAGQPVLYVSAESHHSFLKAASVCGIGADAVRHIAVDETFRMRPDLLEREIAADTRAGRTPFLVVATAGTTNAGIIDPLEPLGAIAAREGLWFHVDAAWGGAAALVPEFRALLHGLDRSDSITFDAHKWLSVPMGAGLYVTRHPTILDRTFRVATAYMPKEAAGLDIVDPHLHSIQWSRRFIGLKLFLTLLVAGWNGYADAIRHQAAMSRLLAGRLREGGWEVVVDSPLAVVCFADPGQGPERQREIALGVVRSGQAWISTTLLGRERRTVLRACITNFKTEPVDIEALVSALKSERAGLLK